MKRQLTSFVLSLGLFFLLPLTFTAAAAAQEGRATPRVSLPVSGTFTDTTGGTGKFSGTFIIHRFAAVERRVHAVGTLSGTLTDSTGKVLASGLQVMTLPVDIGTGQAAATPASGERNAGTVKFVGASYTGAGPSKAQFVATSLPTATAQVSCQILRLSTGAIDLNLLGLVVHLDPILLVVTAVPGAGNLLGNLLCAIVNLLNPGGLGLTPLIQLLNQLLALLGAL